MSVSDKRYDPKNSNRSGVYIYKTNFSIMFIYGSKDGSESFLMGSHSCHTPIAAHICVPSMVGDVGWCGAPTIARYHQTMTLYINFIYI